MPSFQTDEMQAAALRNRAETIRTLINAGFTRESARDSVNALDLSGLVVDANRLPAV